MSTMELREKGGPFWAAYQAYIVETDRVDGCDYVPDWFLVKVLRTRLAKAQSEVEDLLPPARLYSPDDPVLEVRREFMGVIGALERLLGFFETGQADPLGARERALAALLGAENPR